MKSFEPCCRFILFLTCGLFILYACASASCELNENLFPGGALWVKICPHFCSGNPFNLNLELASLYSRLAERLWHFSAAAHCVCRGERALEVWGRWLMHKASASVTRRKEIRARCQQISTSTCLTQLTRLCGCMFACVQSWQSRTEDSGANQVIFQRKFNFKNTKFFYLKNKNSSQGLK